MQVSLPGKKESSEMVTLTGKVAIVTGTSAPGGIGRAIAWRLAQDGAAVVLTDIDEPLETPDGAIGKAELLALAVSELKASGGTAAYFMADVTKKENVQRCIEFAKARFGGVDILVNNAGSLAGSANILDTEPSQWEDSFLVNLLGPTMLSKAAIVEMRKTGSGSIVNIGSTKSLGAEAGFGAYTSMKHGLIGLTKTIAAEYGVDGIRCNAVCPGYINTEMHILANKKIAANLNLSIEEVKERRYANVALRSAGDPEDVANAVAFLAGPESAYITGAVLPVAGGAPIGV
ncbi:3-oxoacyl-[acyl-carrier-protein] reductase FabG [Ruegeria denitrificans]|uniref:3-oxoacyl-[acyl-carrier-protein] reductase FabG n=1 Tax=Ruegeria denitrificans TaxID=1715692 RepID=A0A0P1ISR5_9RHOB|nr:SDR family NAD(P)-dependent oxidoreductase [Ruegeria denitrificans]CUK18921.1 3-oxoacyl-[acyl-carrier-protein] reductase FabG [Ruegeria denitrificans]